MNRTSAKPKIIVRVPYSSTSYDVSDIASLSPEQQRKLLVLLNGRCVDAIRAQFPSLSKNTLAVLDNFKASPEVLSNQISTILAQLPGDKLTGLAKQMTASTDPKKAALRRKLVRGFYGTKTPVQDSPER